MNAFSKLLLAATLIGGCLPGQSSADDGAWDRLQSRSGQQVLIVRADGSEVRGRLDRFTNLDLTVGSKRLVREQVREVYGLRKGKGWKSGLIGAAIGFGAGFGLLAIAKAGGGDWAWSDGPELFAPIGAAIGFPVGVLIGRSRSSRELLYRAP